MTKSALPSNGVRPQADGIEVVELSDVDLEFEAVFGPQAAPPAPVTIETTQTKAATVDELRALEIFRDLDGKELDALAARCQSIHAVPGYVLLAPGRINGTVYFVLDGQLRIYTRIGDKRPIAIVEAGHSTGLRSALDMQPVDHAAIATEVSHILAFDLSAIDEHLQRSHAFARNYAALLASYVRGDHCLTIGRTRGATARQSYVDERTLLHNQHWLDSVYPRLVTRCRLSNKRLAAVGFAIDKLDVLIKALGIDAGLRLIETVGHWVLDQTRPTDLLALNQSRYFYVFAPDGDLDTARQLAERLKAEVAALAFAPIAGKPPVKVTLSLGVAALGKSTREREFLTQIDALIRQSLNQGGDCVSQG